MKKYSDSDLPALHRLSFCNRELLSKEHECACFFCLARMRVDEIAVWYEERDGKETAVCPKCDTDSIVPSSVFDDDLLKRMQKKYFQWSSESNG